LDEEVEFYYQLDIERLQNKYGRMGYRKEAAKVLQQILDTNQDVNIVIALSPAGLMRPYLQVVESAQGITILLHDSPENIFKRLVFYDIDSKIYNVHITPKQKPLYIRSIRQDIAYFKRSYQKAQIFMDITGLSIQDSVDKIYDLLKQDEVIMNS
jgi:shikimate kinase